MSPVRRPRVWVQGFGGLDSYPRIPSPGFGVLSKRAGFGALADDSGIEILPKCRGSRFLPKDPGSGVLLEGPGSYFSGMPF